MFTLDSTIDSIQTAKKTAISTVFAKHEKVADALNQFVDAQTAYTKSAVKASTDVATKLYGESIRFSQEAMKYDWTKHFDSVTEAFKVKTK
jgi:hypothetical protein